MKYLVLFWLALIIGCLPDKMEDSQPFVMEYFPDSGIRTYSIKTSNSANSLYINDEFKEKITSENWKLWDSIYVSIPDRFELESYEVDQKIRSFTDGNDVFTIQLIQDNTDDAFDFFIEIYNHAIENDYGFDLLSCEHFETKLSDFVVYDLKLEMNREVKYILGCISSKRKTVFYDFGFISNNPINNVDRYYFTEAINSLNDGGKKILPTTSHIIKHKTIEVSE